MRDLWLRMAEIYGNQWTSQHGNEDTNNTWAKGLQDITPKMLAGGLMRCLMRSSRNAWPPTLPEFRNLCLDLPAMDRAINLALNNLRTDDAFIIAMRRYIGSWELANKTLAELKPIARDAYEYACQEKIRLNQKRLTHE